MKYKFAIPTILILVISSAYADSEPPLPLLSFGPKDASVYASQMADSIKDLPECMKFKEEIMSHATGSRYDGKTITPILTAKQRAAAVGCTKANIASMSSSPSRRKEPLDAPDSY